MRDRTPEFGHDGYKPLKFIPLDLAILLQGICPKIKISDAHVDLLEKKIQ